MNYAYGDEENRKIPTKPLPSLSVRSYFPRTDRWILQYFISTDWQNFAFFILRPIDKTCTFFLIWSIHNFPVVDRQISLLFPWKQLINFSIFHHDLLAKRTSFFFFIIQSMNKLSDFFHKWLKNIAMIAPPPNLFQHIQWSQDRLSDTLLFDPEACNMHIR